LLLLLAAVARAQTGATSVLTGNVVDASTHAPVSDVVVTATSPSLQGEQVVVTDTTGLYRVPQLPPARTPSASRRRPTDPSPGPGWTSRGPDAAPQRRAAPETAGEATVTVIGAAPVIDVGSSTTGSVINQDFVRNLAVSRPNGIGGANRSFDSLAATAPQAGNDTYGVSISGSQSPENSYLIDGLAVNDTAYGVNGSPLTIEFIDEVNVITGGYMPEYGRSMGGALSAVTKSGGNEFHGSIWGNFTPGALAGSAAASNATGSTGVVSVTNDLYNIGDFGATLGGYIIKDKLWFFAGLQPSFQRYSWTRSFNAAQVAGGGNLVTDPATGQVVYAPIPDSAQRGSATRSHSTSSAS
jgi:hypothetical protein